MTEIGCISRAFGLRVPITTKGCIATRSKQMNYKDQLKLIKSARRALKTAKKVQRKLRNRVDASHQAKNSWKRVIAKSMRLNPTPCEAILYDALTEAGIEFKPQEIVGPYIVDVLIGDKHVVEVDGGVHETRVEYDLARDQFMWRRGYRVHRFTNYQIKHELSSVIEQIRVETK